MGKVENFHIRAPYIFFLNNNLLILMNLESWKFPNEAHFD